MYKALNTFVDDLFAFIIKMPTMHRVACFRDGKQISILFNENIISSLSLSSDIIFFIFLYQRWIYPVDKKRVNEFGQGGDDDDGAAAPADAGAGAGADGGDASTSAKPKED